MTDDGTERAIVPPVTSAGPRPRWSVMIPTYNCAGYLRETLASVLAQDPGPERMQIEVVDDASAADDPEAVVRELAGGRVGFFRQPSNVGHVRNFNTALSRSCGELVHLLHGDDYVRPGFYQAMERAFDERPDLGAAFCRHIFTDDRGRHWRSVAPLLQPRPGVLPRAAERLGALQPIQTPAIVVRREAYERLGGFDPRMQTCGEDWEMWVRIAAHYPVWYEPEPLAVYRKHGISLSGRAARTGQNLRDLRCAVSVYREYVPPARRDAVERSARRLTARWGLELAHRFVAAGELDAARAQLAETVRTSRDPRELLASARLAATIAHHAIMAGS